MRFLKIISGVLSGISALITVTMPILSSHMQSFYKGQIDDFSKNAQELLDKKQLWVQIGESKLFFYIFIACLSAFVIVILIAWLKARKSK